jgi:hypothetical protein
MYTTVMAQLKAQIVRRRSIFMSCIHLHILVDADGVLESLTFGFTFGVLAVRGCIEDGKKSGSAMICMQSL